MSPRRVEPPGDVADCIGVDVADSTDNAEGSAAPRMAGTTALDCDVPGLSYLYFATTYLADDGLPVDGHWTVVHDESDRRIHSAPFRTLHAAAHLAYRAEGLTDWTVPMESLPTADLGPRLRHAEAHAHDVDAVYPPGNVVEFGNGPNVVDDDGTTRQFLSGAPIVEWEKDENGDPVCAECGERPAFAMEWSA